MSESMDRKSAASNHSTGILPIEISMDELGEPGLYRLAMTNPAEAKNRLAHIDTVLEYVREELSRLDTARVALEGMAETLRRGLAGEPAQSKARAERGPAIRASTYRFREGSKKHRLYVAIAACLRDGPMYINDLMKNIPPELFETINSDKKNHLFNQLSQLKKVGLLTSDNRGNWTLPDREATT